MTQYLIEALNYSSHCLTLGAGSRAPDDLRGLDGSQYSYTPIYGIVLFYLYNPQAIL